MLILDNRFEGEGILRESNWSILHLARDNELSRDVHLREIKPHALAANPEVRQYLSQHFGPGATQSSQCRTDDLPSKSRERCNLRYD